MKKHLAISLLSILLIGSCGQTGPLVLPPEKADTDPYNNSKPETTINKKP